MSRILVVDDEVLVRDVLRSGLTKLGHEVVEASDAEGGLEAYEQEPPDIVLCDLLMPGGGVTLIGQLSRKFPEARIVAMSGGSHYGYPDLLPLAEKHGAVATLQKPFTLTEVMDVLKEVAG